MSFKERSGFKITVMFFGLFLFVFSGAGLAGPMDSAGQSAPQPSKTLSNDHLVTAFYTYLGGGDYDEVQDMVIDGSGAIYIVGGTYSSDFPIVNGYQSTFGGDRDVFLAKFSADGTQLLFSTYLGGPGDDYGLAIELDAAGNIVIAGQTDSPNFPVVNGYQSTLNGTSPDGFVAKFSADGSTLLYSTYLGGTGGDFILDMKLKSTGEICVTGITDSSDFPVFNAVDNTRQGSEAFVTEFTADGSALVFSTFLGGSGQDFGHGLALDGNGNLYVTGCTTSLDFPVVNPFQAAKCGPEYNYDVFVTKISATGSALLYSTYLGGTDSEFGYDINVDAGGAAYVVGGVRSTDFPTTPGSYQPVKSDDTTYSGCYITKLSPAGNTLAYSTYLDGSEGNGMLSRVVLLNDGSAYVTGYTTSENYPLLNPVVPWQIPGGVNLARLSADGSTLEYSTCLFQSGGNGFGLAVDASGAVYISGSEGSGNCAYQGCQMTNHGLADGFAVKLMPCSTDRVSITSPIGGEEWEVESKEKITWTAPETVKNVRIELHYGTGVELIDDNAPNTGTFTWEVSNFPSTTCRIVIVDAAPGGWLYGESENYFTILPPQAISVQVLSPNGGERLEGGSVYTIRWSTTGSVPDVVIYYSNDNGLSYRGLGNPSNTGSFDWPVPEPGKRPWRQCLIKIVTGDGSAQDTSDQCFMIK